jgi:hypothetical protein
MKSKFLMTGILSMALVFGMMVAGCSNDSGDDGGGGGPVTVSLASVSGEGNAFTLTLSKGEWGYSGLGERVKSVVDISNAPANFRHGLWLAQIQSDEKVLKVTCYKGTPMTSTVLTGSFQIQLKTNAGVFKGLLNPNYAYTTGITMEEAENAVPGVNDPVTITIND